MNRFFEMDQNDDASRNLEMGIMMITNFVLKKMLISIVFIIMSSKGFVYCRCQNLLLLERERERERERSPSCEETPISEIRGKTKTKSERHHLHHHHE
jgi:hypothetical protein